VKQASYARELYFIKHLHKETETKTSYSLPEEYVWRCWPFSEKY